MDRRSALPLVGILAFATDISTPVAELARAIEERGFDGIVLPEHTHIPVSRETAYPAGTELPDRYRRVLDPYVALAVVASQTSLQIGTCISLVAQHDPIALAKAIATLDFISEGRFALGVGFGWNREELADHGHRFADRRDVVREHVELMRSLWCEQEAEFRGEHVSVSRSWAWPKPVRQPMPVLLGCAPTNRGYEEIVRWADGWIPGGDSPDMLAGWLKTLKGRWCEAGRDESGPIIWAMQSVADDDVVRANLDRFRSLGVTQVLLDVQSASREELLPLLDRYAKVIASLD